MNRLCIGLLLAWTTVLPAAGQDPGELPGPGPATSVHRSFALPGGLTGELSVLFERVTDLSLANLGISLQRVSPNDPNLLARLPAGVSLPTLCPVLVRIEPPPAGGLAFQGVARIEMLFLPLLQRGNWRMYAAPSGGGSFKDITASVIQLVELGLGGAYRVLGTRGGFSEFLIVNDPRPLDQAIAHKLGQLEQSLAANAAAIPPAVHASLAADLAAVRTHAENGDDAAALADLFLFLATVEQHSGPNIPDLWRAARDLVNVAGLLRAEGETLRFSLQLRKGLGQ